VGEDGGLIAGHARVLAARQLGIAEIPVMVAGLLEQPLWRRAGPRHRGVRPQHPERIVGATQRGHEPPKRANGNPAAEKRLETFPAGSTRIKKNGTPRTPGGCIVDSRWQACSKETPNRAAIASMSWRSACADARHAVSAATNRLGLGDRLRLIPGHCDPTVNLYE
jgi:hypothetical protein